MGTFWIDRSGGDIDFRLGLHLSYTNVIRDREIQKEVADAWPEVHDPLGAQ